VVSESGARFPTHKTFCIGYQTCTDKRRIDQFPNHQIDVHNVLLSGTETAEGDVDDDDSLVEFRDASQPMALVARQPLASKQQPLIPAVAAAHHSVHAAARNGRTNSPVIFLQSNPLQHIRLGRVPTYPCFILYIVSKLAYSAGSPGQRAVKWVRVIVYKHCVTRQMISLVSTCGGVAVFFNDHTHTPV